MNGSGHPAAGEPPDDLAGVDARVAELANNDDSVRKEARLALVRAGHPAVAGLVEALADPRRQVRWEAAMTLEWMADPDAAAALVGALRDRDFSVRWLAAKGIVALGDEGLAPLLRELVEHSDSNALRESARHVLHDLSNRGGRRRRTLLQPLLAALDDVEPVLAVPPAAAAVLQAVIRARPEGDRH